MCNIEPSPSSVSLFPSLQLIVNPSWVVLKYLNLHLICCWLAYKFTLFLFVYRVYTHAEQCSLNMFAVAASLHCFYIINPCILYCIRHSVHVNVHQLHTARCACTCSYMCFNYYQYEKFFNLKTRVDYLQHTADHQQHCRLSLQTCSTVNGWGRGGLLMALNMRLWHTLDGNI